jgi:hypothetical protein
MAAQNNEVEYHLSDRSVRWLVNALQTNQLKVSKHQRHAGVWVLDYKQKFIDSMKRGHPCPLVLIYQSDDGTLWLEDGLQRLTTIRTFLNDEFGELASGQKFSDWCEVHRQLFEHKKIPVMIYSNADALTRVLIFDRFQNGSPLKPGERLNSLGETALVTMTRRLLLADIDDDGNVVRGDYYDRLCSILGHIRIGDDDKRYTQLLDMVAVMNGMANGFVDGSKGISKKYVDLRDNLATAINEEEVRRVIDELLWIFEEARRRYPMDDRVKIGVYRNPGNFIGPIVYSLKMFPGDWERLRNGWIDVIIRFAQTPSRPAMKAFLHNPETGLLRGVSKARSWNNERWRFIYENAFNIPHANPLPLDDGDETDDTE